jgi:hypothetical protein
MSCGWPPSGVEIRANRSSETPAQARKSGTVVSFNCSSAVGSMAAKIGRDWRTLLDILWSESEESREGLGEPLDLLVEWIDRLLRAKRAFGWSLSPNGERVCKNTQYM